MNRRREGQARAGENGVDKKRQYEIGPSVGGERSGFNEINRLLISVDEVVL
jgi:hypothetical protein